MKKKLSLILALSSAFLLASCGGGGEGGQKEGLSTSEKETSAPSVIIHFYGKGLDYSKYALWLWKKGGDGAEYLFTSTDDYGAIATVPISTFGVSDVSELVMGTIMKKKGTWDGQSGDMFADMSLAVKDEKGNGSIWLKYGDETIYYSEPSKYSFSKSEFASLTSIKWHTSDPVSSLKLLEGEKTVKEKILDAPTDYLIWDLGSDFEINFASTYYLEAKFSEEVSLRRQVSFNPVYDTAEYNALYQYDGKDLGASYSKERTVFKAWSPSSSKITLRIYGNGTPVAVSNEKGDDTHKDYEMKLGEKGVWSYSLEGDQEGKYYTFVVTNGSYEEQEIVDPYAKSAGVNGARGMIVDFSKTNPEGWDKVKVNEYDKKSLTVYETHVADLTSSATWTGSEGKRKRFLGLAEEGTSYGEGEESTPTGFDYIKSLGVNAVQLQPIFDQDNDEVNTSFNWGYNPLNYNVLEGSYSSDPYDGYARIKEFKEAVKAYNNAGINIIMDVVYNHVASVYGRNFDVLAPGYFYRYKDDGSLSNGSGCGNDTASERSMFANFMEQSASFWASEYKLGGFRFDLMGLHPIKTMNQVVKSLHQINPSIVVYGEPWTLSTSCKEILADQAGIKGSMDTAEDFAAFNDGFRDAMIKGGMKGASEIGFATCTSVYQINASDMNAVANGIKGTTQSGAIIDDPDRTVNYVTCHDNYTLLDRFSALDKASIEVSYTEEQKERMNVLANAITFTSQGVSFMQEGEEFLRSKGGENNSYGGQKDGRDYYKMNELDYSLAIKHKDMVANYKELIKFKQECAGLHLNREEASNIQIKKDEASSRNELVYDLPDGKGGTYRIAHVNGGSANPSPIDFSGFALVLDTLNSGLALGEATSLSPYQTIIAHKAA